MILKLFAQRAVTRLLSMASGAAICLIAATTQADVKFTQKRTDDGVMMHYQLTVHPAPEPVPALKYRFTVLPHETKAGNAVTHYLRSYGENSLQGRFKGMENRFGDEIYDWPSLEIASSDLPLEKLKAFSEIFDGYVDGFIRPATVCRDADWDLAEEELSGKEMITYLLPSIQQTRSISRALMVRTRLAIAEGRFEDAVEHIKMNYRLAQTVSKMKFLVCSLVGIAEVGMGLNSTIDMIGAPNSPNLYWALAEYPNPLIDMRDTMRLEMSLGLRFIPEFENIESASYTEEEWNRIYKNSIDSVYKIQDLISQQSGMNDSKTPPMSALTGISSYTNAKKRLIAGGYDEQVVNEMAVGQVLMLDGKFEYQRIANDIEKLLYTDLSYAEFLVESREAESQSAPSGVPALGKLLAEQLLPATVQVKSAQFRLNWQRRGLQAVEAIRMHAAETGKLPKTLSEIQVVHVPKNPLTGQPFVYRLNGDTAILDMPHSDGMPGFAQRFEIKLAK